LASWWVEREIKTVLEREHSFQAESAKQVLKLIPLDLDGYIWSLEWSLGVYASDIRNREAPNFRGWETDNRNFDTQVEQEIKALRSDGEGRELPAQS
jgi:hypothetical protein